VEVNRWRADRELVGQLGAPYRFIDLEVDVNWFQNYLNARGSAVRCAVVEPDVSDNIIALVSLVAIDHLHRSAELHLMVGDTCNQGRGIGTFATQEMLLHAFDDLNLRRVSLGVLATNERAQRLYRKIGFKDEGVLREARAKNGLYTDLVLMGLLSKEWRGQT